ncbi:unnamed protein product [Effrenium voratum]|uniref:alpha-amylase n=1 Tax=Effrenium voratum TaxID=2562239 RepID=A0AA36J9U2_9DINO|nr:unnamed protein product [Effrenium voratum]
MHVLAFVLLAVSSGECNNCKSKNGGTTLLQMRTKSQELHESKRIFSNSNFLMLENEDGNCLEASNAPMNGVRPTMQLCDVENFMQQWNYEEETGLIHHSGGKCLDASQRNLNAGLIHMWECHLANENQMWEWGENKMIKNQYGICMDAPSPQQVGSQVHMWTCRADLSNQRWHFTNGQDFNMTTTATTSPATTATSPATTSSTSTSGTSASTEGPSTSPMSTTTGTTTPQPLSAVRNCQLEPLVEGSGCKQLQIFEDARFGLGANGQETEGRHRCLEQMREVKGDSFVHSVGRCEVWRCGTAARLRMSAGPGGGLSSSPDAVALVGANGQYVSADEDGSMHSSEESFVPEALFEMKEVEPGKVTLKAKSNDKFVKAVPGGHLVAETWHWDDWEVFSLEKHEDGQFALRSFHNLFITVGEGGSISATSPQGTGNAAFQVLNKSQAAWEEAGGQTHVDFGKTISMESAHATCSRPSEKATVRCCAEDGTVESGGCVGNKTLPGARALCEERGLQLCSAQQVRACADCAGCGKIWTSGTCTASEGLTQRRLNLRNDRAGVFSELCQYQPGKGGLHGEEERSAVLVKLMEWNYNDIAKECTEYLAPNGFEAVQVAPVTEHVVGYQWWVKYQPVSAGLDTRSGTEAEFKAMVATCRAVGVEVIVDILMNHMASPCKEAQSKHGTDDMPCAGWGGSKFGNRKAQGARGWDASTPANFHHSPDDETKPFCSVGPHTGWLCPDDDCTPCDMYSLPDYNTELQEVRDMQYKHLAELFHIGVTGLRVDAAIYHHVYELADMLNRLPWDLVYQEWWGEYPPQDRTDHVGLYRDVAYRWHLVNRLAGKNATDLGEVFDLDGGVFGITQDMAVYPFAYHDGRSRDADPEIATYKNGLAYHQQQKFFLSWPLGNTVLVWGGYGWRDLNHGPPGCDKADGDHCSPLPVYDESGNAQCMPAPTESPLPRDEARERRWICEHRWQGVAGMMHFRKSCRTKGVSKVWKGDEVALGRAAFRLGEDCFVALVRGRRPEEPPEAEVVGVGGTWDLQGFHVGLPAGRYCDMSSLHTQGGWDQTSCPRTVEVDANGIVLRGAVTQGELLAIHTGARLKVLLS